MVARNLAGVARTVRIVDLPDLPEKGDVSDWIAAGGTREALEALVAAAPSAGAGPNGTATTPTGTPPPAKVSQATLLLELATDLELFHAPDADPAAYCRVAVDDHHEVYRIPSRAVRALLARRFYREHRKAVRGQSLAEAVAMLEARALMEGDAHPVATRIAEHGGAIYLDLCDPGW